MDVKILDKTGLGYFSGKIKAWCNATFAAITHNHASNAVNAMTGYSKPSSGSAIASSDSLNSAVGKLEAKIDAITVPTIPNLSRTISGSGNAITDITVSGHAITATKGTIFLTSHQDISGKVNKSGDTMTGTITANVSNIIKRDVTDNILSIYGGTSSANGARFELYGGTRSINPGSFVITASIDSSNNKQLLGKPNGTLTWGGTAISLDGHTHSYLPLDGGTLTGQLVINRANGNAGGGIKLTGAGQNFAISISDTNITKGTVPSSAKYLGIDFYGKDIDNYNKRLGMIDYTLTSGNVSQIFLKAYNCTTNTNTGTCAIGACVDGSGNVYTYAPTPGANSNDTNIATTKWVKDRAYITSSSNITGTASNVTGTVAIANGGTGATSRLNAVKALTNENVGTGAQYFLTITSSWGKAGYTSVADAKTVLGLGSAAYTASTAYATASHTHSYVAKSGDTMTGNLVIKKNGPEFHLRSDEIAYNSIPSANKYMTYYFKDSSNNNLSRLFYYKNTGSGHEVGFEMGMCDHNSTDLNVVFKGKMNANYKTAVVGSVFQYFRSDGKNTCALGSSDYKWSNVYATTSSIGSSDERMKCNIALIPDEVLDLWGTIPFKQFKFKHAVKDKGSNARLHTGMIAQDIKRIFEDNNINPNIYGLFCYDEWEETPEILHDDGTVCQEYQPAGSEYALRYAELLCVEAAYQRRKNKILENRISELEMLVKDIIANSQKP